jgi:hypothetical protein
MKTPFREEEGNTTTTLNASGLNREIATSVKGDHVECVINGAVVAGYNRTVLVTAGKLKSFSQALFHDSRSEVSAALNRSAGREPRSPARVPPVLEFFGILARSGPGSRAVVCLVSGVGRSRS